MVAVVVKSNNNALKALTGMLGIQTLFFQVISFYSHKQSELISKF